MPRTAKKIEVAPSTSVFGNAPKIVTNKGPASRSKNPEVRLTEGRVNRIASLKSLIACLENLCQIETTELKEEANERFVADGLRAKARPENFKAIDTFSSASVQLRAKTYPLNDDELELVRKYEIDTVSEEKVAETFRINPAYASDPDFVHKLEIKLGPTLVELQDERGAIIEAQAGVVKHKVSEAGMHAVFRQPEEVVRELLPVVFTSAIRAKLETNGDLERALREVEKLLGTPLGREVAKEAASNPEALAKKTKAKAGKSE